MCYVFKVPSALSHNPSSLQMPVVDMKREDTAKQIWWRQLLHHGHWPALLGYSILFANSVRKLFRKNVV